MDGASTPSQPPPSPDIPLADLTRTQLVQIYNLSDREAWNYSDEILCAAALLVWPSVAYRHFTTTLVRHYLKNVNGALEPDYLEFKFICRYQPDKCKVGRKRKSTGDGTSNLRKAIKKCDKDRMVPDSLAVLPPDYIPYSQLMFRVLLVIWCVVNYRPFQTVSDPAFLDIVRMLRPEAIVPTPHTLSSDLTYIYNLATLRIREVFLEMDTGVHLAIDGWSSPLTASFLGVVVFWRTGPTLWRSVLEFIHLTESHTGSYLAEKTLECLDRFGLRHHIVSVCLDNASNNNTLVQHLALSLPNFPGSEFRGRCLAHITNLAAKAYMAVFTRPPPRKRRIAHNARVLARQSATNSSGRSDTSEIANRDEADLPPLDELDVALEIPGELIDEGMEQHDTTEVQNAVGLAVEEVANTFALQLSDAELKEAREVFPKAAGFANQIHGSGTLYAAFIAIRNQCKDLLTTQKEVPTQRVVTRWGANLACARTHGELRPAIDTMTSRPGYKLGKFQMSPAQWEMLDECVKCLEIFEEPTHIHSQSNTALVHEVIPHLLLMKFRLGLIRDAIYDPETKQPLRLVSRVAAVAAIHVINKYLKLLEAADIYWLAIVLCPWYKIQWLNDHGYSPVHIERVCQVLFNRFADYTLRFGTGHGSTAGAAVTSTQPSNPRPRRFMQHPTPISRATTFQSATFSSALSNYLSSPPLAKTEILKAGGLIQYWENESKAANGSILGRMALDILSAPSSSVDVERAFSGGRMATNYRQHRTSVATFRAKMAVGSWLGTPLLSGAEEMYEMLDGKGNTEPEPLD